jgi:hypothetical protein
MMPRSSKSKASATGIAKSAAGQARAIAASSKTKKRASSLPAKRAGTRTGTRSIPRAVLGSNVTAKPSGTSTIRRRRVY